MMFRNIKYSLKRICCVTNSTLIVVYLFTVGSTTVSYAFQPADFKPFAAVDLVDINANSLSQYNITGGETKDVNEAGQAVGY